MTTVKEMNKAVEPFGLVMKRLKWGFTFTTIDPVKEETCEVAKWGMHGMYYGNLPLVKIEDVIESAERLAKRMAELPPTPQYPTFVIVTAEYWKWYTDQAYRKNTLVPYADLVVLIEGKTIQIVKNRQSFEFAVRYLATLFPDYEVKEIGMK